MKFRRSDGFTLLEIMVVVVIVRIGVKQLASELELYKLDNGRYPSGDQGLVSLVREPASEPRPGHYPAGGYTEADSLIDPWKNPYNYDRPGVHNPPTFDVYSFADDGQPGGDGANADIGNWETP